jgi:hypothetical protein
MLDILKHFDVFDLETTPLVLAFEQGDTSKHSTTALGCRSERLVHAPDMQTSQSTCYSIDVFRYELGSPFFAAYEVIEDINQCCL